MRCQWPPEAAAIVYCPVDADGVRWSAQAKLASIKSSVAVVAAEAVAQEAAIAELQRQWQCNVRLARKLALVHSRDGETSGSRVCPRAVCVLVGMKRYPLPHFQGAASLLADRPLRFRRYLVRAVSTRMGARLCG